MRRHVEGMLWITVPVSLILAAGTSAKILLIVLGIVALGATAVVIPLHFFRAWRRLGSVPNRREYAVWVGLETLFAVSLVAGLVFTLSSH